MFSPDFIIAPTFIIIVSNFEKLFAYIDYLVWFQE